MSTPTSSGISRPVALLIGGLVGILLLYLIWVFAVQPLLSPGDPVAQQPLPVPTAVAPLPTEDPADLSGAVEDPLLEELLELDEVEAEQFQIASARDPFRQVVIEAQVDQPVAGGATGGSTTGGATTGGATTGGTTGGGATGDGTTGGGATGGGTGTGTGDGAGTGGGTTGGSQDTTNDGTELAATGLGTDRLAVALLALLGLGTAAVAGTRRLA